jgi:hypothetical protein
MRVRPNRTSSTRRMAGPARRRHDAPAPAPAVPAERPPQRRARASGGPIDRAQYACACGFVFEAAVSTSVTCPHCGAGQAW